MFQILWSSLLAKMGEKESMTNSIRVKGARAGVVAC